MVSCFKNGLRRLGAFLVPPVVGVSLTLVADVWVRWIVQHWCFTMHVGGGCCYQLGQQQAMKQCASVFSGVTILAPVQRAC